MFFKGSWEQWRKQTKYSNGSDAAAKREWPRRRYISFIVNDRSLSALPQHSVEYCLSDKRRVLINTPMLFNESTLFQGFLSTLQYSICIPWFLTRFSRLACVHSPTFTQHSYIKTEIKMNLVWLKFFIMFDTRNFFFQVFSFAGDIIMLTCFPIDYPT